MDHALVACARMYAVAPSAAAAWHRLLTHVVDRSGVAMDVIDHPAPAPLGDLWSRDDLGCAFMCGWPLALEDQGAAAAGKPFRPIIAAPVTAAAWSAGAPVYRSDFLVAANAPFRTLADTFGHRFALSSRESHSGFNMPLAHWAAAEPPFSQIIGPLVAPRRCIEAVVAGNAEVTAVDSYVLLLLQRHDPALAAQVRVIDSTAANSAPPLVGSAALHDDDLHRLRATLTSLHQDDPGRTLLADLALLRFVEANHATYTATLAVAEKFSPAT